MTLTLAATLTALTLPFLAAYASACWLNPFTRCRRCAGTGHRTTVLRAVRACRRCRGTGMRLRTGRALANYARTVHHGATNPNLPAHLGAQAPGTQPTPAMPSTFTD